MINNLDIKNPVDIIFLNFGKSFDKVPHKLLIKMLKADGICGNISKWIENWPLSIISIRTLSPYY